MAFHQWNGMGFDADVNLRVEEVSSLAKKQRISSSKEQTQYSNLTRYSNEKCLYCHRLFFNKLQLYMHNTRHLYIPVEKQRLSDVIIKSLYTSQNLVSNINIEESQTSNTEKTVTNKQIRNVGFKKMLSKTYKKIQDKKVKDLDREILNHKEKVLKDLMTDCKVNLGENIPIRIEKDTRKEPVNDILSNFTNNCIVNLNDFFSTIQTDSNNVLRDSYFGKLIPESSVIASNDSLQTNTIVKNVFLNKNITVKRVEQNNEFNESIKEVNNTKSDELKSKDTSLSNMLLVGKKQDDALISNECKDVSVSYHKLVRDVKKGVLCKLCSKTFTNRYKAIVHESSHILLRIQRIDMYLNNKPYRCKCLENFATLKLYAKHAKHCSKGPHLKPNSNSANKKNNLKKERETEKKIQQNNNLKTMDITNIDLNSNAKKQKKICPYCKSDSTECSDQCSVIRSDVMRSGDSTYFCKECFSKMEVNLTKVGMYNGNKLIRRCVVCNSVGNNFVLAFMTAECVLGI